MLHLGLLEYTRLHVFKTLIKRSKKEKKTCLVKAQLIFMFFPRLPTLLDNFKGFYSEAETSIYIQPYMVSLHPSPPSPFMCTGDCGFSYRLKCMHVS